MKKILDSNTMCYAFRKAIIEHPGIFESLQWHNSYSSDVNKKATKGIIDSLYQVLETYHISEEQMLHILRIMRGFVQGFASIEAHGGFGDPISVDISFDLAVDFTRQQKVLSHVQFITHLSIP